MARRFRERLWLQIVLCAALVTFAGAPPAAAGTDDTPRTLDDLFELFDVGDVAADFVIVVDTSGSMSQGATPPYPSVLEAYSVLIDAIPDGDVVSVVTFDTDPNLVFQGTVSPGSRSRARSALPPEAKGLHTDIGAAIDATLRRLERADSSEVQTVIFLTDGVHDPAEGSAYPEKSGPSWQALRERAAEVDRTRDLLVLGIGIAEGTDVDLLRTVFGNPEINSLPPDQLGPFFEEAVRRSQLARLRKLVEAELEHDVRITSSDQAILTGHIRTTVVLESRFTKLPVEVTIRSIDAVDGNGLPVDASLAGDETFTIFPGDTATVEVVLEPELEQPGFTVPPKTETAEFEVALDATFQVQPAGLLARVTQTDLTGRVTGTHTVDTARTFGWTITRVLTLAAGVLLALLILYALYRRFLRLPKLVGVFELANPAIPAEQRVIRLKGKRMTLTQARVLGAGTAKLTLFTRRGKPGHVYASVEQPPFYEVVDGRRERQVNDETEIRFGTYRLGQARIQYRVRERRRPRTGRTRNGGRVP